MKWIKETIDKLRTNYFFYRLRKIKEKRKNDLGGDWNTLDYRTSVRFHNSLKR